eukprot:TRINITY_DN513_c4_g2_i1.p1 TRINITY_DN513_c4_g2~~TRINITY_DN513_c4_g2_i1.p1  ORF type:complete len:383 (+),score=74.52 TRINITY_DN513_c4_g2_i1:115-1263(+)
MTSTGIKRKLIIDTDCGGDDAVAMMAAFSHPEVEVIALTCCWGNVGVVQSTENAGKLLDFYGLDIPFYKGAEGPLLGTRETVAWEGYGKDGYGDADFPTAIHQPSADTPACLALLELLKDVKPYDEETNNTVYQLAILGPCTNIALALKLNPNICDNLGGAGYPGLIVMGGAYEAKGNSNMAAEFNFHCDPEAAYILFNTVTRPVHLVAWEVTVSCPMTWDWFDKWLGRGGEQNRVQLFFEKLFKRLESFTRARETGEEPVTQDETCVIPDAVAMAVVLEPSCILECFDTFCTVELWGRETRGMTVIDWYGTELSMKKADRWRNCSLITKMDQEVFLRIMDSIVKHAHVSQPVEQDSSNLQLFEHGRRRSKACQEAATKQSE